MYDLEALYQIFKEHPAVCIDSRKVQRGSLFFALRGDNFDGNQYAAQALAEGAAYAIVDDAAMAVSDRYMCVPDVLEALQDLARHHRRSLYLPVIAITGSNGKTTTKELVNAVLSQKYATLCTKGNFNNHIGVPLTLLQLRPDHEVAIIEMGANHLLEIESLCAIAEPTHGLVTNMGKAHLEGFGSEEGVREGKAELYAWLAKNSGLAFVNLDEPWLNEKAIEKKVQRAIRYTSSVSLDATHVPIEVNLKATAPFVIVEFLSDDFSALRVESLLMGQYNFPNILTAIALGKYFRVPGAQIKTAIEGYLPSNNRSQVLEREGLRIFLDAYNANPDSMKVALENLALQPGYKVALLGDMLELGKNSTLEHLEIVNLADRLAIDLVVTVGNFFSSVPKPTQVLHFKEVMLLREWFVAQAFPTDTVVLIKGSRGIQMERILE